MMRDLLNLNLIGGIPAPDSSPPRGWMIRRRWATSSVPLTNPIHTRVYWINAVDGVLSRVLGADLDRNPELSRSSSRPAVWQ